MLQVKLSVVDRIHPQSNKFAKGVENKATGDSKLNGTPATCSHSIFKLSPHTAQYVTKTAINFYLLPVPSTSQFSYPNTLCLAIKQWLPEPETKTSCKMVKGNP